MKTRNDLALFTEDELRAALALFAPDENAREVAAAVYAIPLDEQHHYDWIESAVLMLGCLSDGVAERIIEAFGSDSDSRAEWEAKLGETRRWYDEHVSKLPRRMILTPDEIVYDSRQDLDGGGPLH